MGVGVFEVEVGSDDESFRGSKHFIPETDLRREFVESALRTCLSPSCSEGSVEYIVELIYVRDLCCGLVHMLA